MKYTKRFKDAGWAVEDFLILRDLYQHGRTRVLPLSGAIGVPRTTVSYHLHKLASRNLVERVKVGGHFEWQASESAREMFLEESAQGEFRVAYYRGENEVSRVIEKLFSDKKKERIYFIEPHLQTQKFATSVNQKSIARFAELFQKNKIISEGVTSHRNLEVIQYYGDEVLRHMLGRMMELHVVPNEHIQFEDMVLVYKDKVYILNFYSSLVIEITSESFAQSMKSIIVALSSLGRRFDLNKHIKKVLEYRARKK